MTGGPVHFRPDEEPDVVEYRIPPDVEAQHCRGMCRRCGQITHPSDRCPSIEARRGHDDEVPLGPQGGPNAG